jgi:hypothetical protein
MKARPRPRVFEHISDPRRVLPRCPARAAAAAAEDEKRTDCGGVEAIAKRTASKRGLPSVGPKTHSVMAMMALSGSKKTRARVLEKPTLLHSVTAAAPNPNDVVLLSRHRTLCINSIDPVPRCLALFVPCPALPCPALSCSLELSSLRSFAPAVAPAPPRPFPEAFKLPLQGA